MIAVIKTGGKQYVVSEGKKLKIEKLEKKAGDVFEFEEVLLYKDDKGEILIGKPFLDNVAVKAEVLQEGRGEKKIIFKHKPKKRYKVKRGHRQSFTEVEIKEISKRGSSVKKETAEVKKETVKKETTKKTPLKKEVAKKETKKETPKK